MKKGLCILTVTVVSILIVMYYLFFRKPIIPKKIWSFWDSEELPDFIQKCKNTWISKNPEYQINMLSMKTLENFLTKNEINRIKDWRFNNSPQKLSDLIRLTILEKYGGIWLDASIVCYESLDWVHEKNDKCILYSIPELSKSPLLESWFIACSPGNAYVKKWKEEFFNVDKFDSIDEYVNSSKVDLTGINFKDYLLVYICARKIYLEDPNRVEVMNATKGPYIYHTKGGIKNICNIKKPNFFKFRKEDRASINSEGDKILKCIFDSS